MHNERDFSYTSNASEQQEVLSIREKYIPQTETPLEELKRLDAKVTRPAHVFAYTYGSVSAIVMGAGMSLVMTDIGAILGMHNAMLPGIVIGLVGLIMTLSTYPIFKSIRSARKKKYAPQIIQLSEQLLGK